MSEHPPPSVLDSLWRFRWASAAIVATTVFLSVAAGLLVAPRAQATGTIALTTPQANGVLSAGSLSDATLARYTAQRARFVTSDEVLAAVASRLGREDITGLRHDIVATASSTSSTITITAEADTGGAAVDLAEAVMESYRSETQAEVARLTALAVDSITQTSAQITAGLGPSPTASLSNAAAVTLSDLQLQASQLTLNAVLFGDGVDFVTAPRPEAVAEGGAPVREVALGLILGLVIAGTVAWLRADRDRGVTSALQPEEILEAPLLGELRTRGDLRLRDAPLDLSRLPSHDFRLVWSALRSLVRQSPAGVILVNATGEVARSTTALSVAIAAARDNLSVLIVDADLDHAPLTKALALPGDATGLREVLRSTTDYRERVRAVHVGGERPLAVITVGIDRQGDQAISTRAVEHWVATWREDFDLVVIDAEQIGSGQLSSTLFSAADSLLVVVDEGADERSLRELRRRVTLQGTPVIGYVFAALPRRRSRAR